MDLHRGPCERSVAGFEGHSTNNPLGALAPSELMVMICHTLRTVAGIVRSSSLCSCRARFLLIAMCRTFFLAAHSYRRLGRLAG
jgi:hypothetical protein